MKPRYPYLSLVATIIAAFGGLLFGYSTAIIAGAELFIVQAFQLTTWQVEMTVSMLLAGALVGALLGGFVSDLWGRKTALFVSIAFFFFSGFFLADADSYLNLLVGRFVNGLALGIVSFTVPLYIAEIAPIEKRGAYVSINQMAIAIGIFLAYVVSNHYSLSGIWRPMFSFMLFPAMVQFIVAYFIPETPAWLFSKGRNLEGLRTARMLGVDAGAAHTTEKLKGWKELWSPSFRRPLVIGIGISIFQQITGINTVIYYAPKIFTVGGEISSVQAISMTVWVGLINMIMTFIALLLIDRVGRRPLAIYGLLGMMVSLAFLGMDFAPLAGILFYVASFAISLGPVAWLVISEIYPISIRGRAMGLAAGANWICNYFVSLTFLSLVETIGLGLTFWFYSAICLLALWFVLSQMPETKGKTFEEIQHFWRRR